MIRTRALVVLMLVLTTAAAQSAELLNYNAGSGTTFPGWTWGVDPGQQGYSNYGWASNSGAITAGAWYPRLIQVTGYYVPSTAVPLAEVSAAITTPLGDRTLHVYETGGQTSQSGGPGWYFVYADTMGTRGAANSTTNRLDYYIRLNGTDTWNPASPHGGMMHLGTFVCWNDGTGGSTKSCPAEADPALPQWWLDQITVGVPQAGQHYYHYMYLNGSENAWIHVQLDQRPAHARQASSGGEPVNDPTYQLFGKHYFEHINSMYLEVRYDQSSSNTTEYWVGPFNFWTQAEAQNEISISEVWVGYYPVSGRWEIGFFDNSFNSVGYNSASKSTFEIRWSTNPITNANFNSATIIEPEYWEYLTTNRVRRWDAWSKDAWTRFDLPAGTETNNDKLYFAIKDVSAVANGDGHDAPSSLIKTIDYTLRVSGGDTTPPTLSNPQPSGTLSAGTTSTTVSLTTDESATCRVASNIGTGYDSATNLTTTGGTSHSYTLSGLANGQSYSRYVWCRDAAGNTGGPLTISFSVANSNATTPTINCNFSGSIH